MGVQTPIGLPAQALRRKRLLLGLWMALIAAALGAGLGALVNAHRGGVLLLSVDDLPLDGLAGSAAWAGISDESPASGSLGAVSDDAATPPADEIRWFNGRPVRPARNLSLLVTAYSPDERSCGGSADGITASGYSVLTNGGRLAAADTRILPLGSLITVPGYDAGAIIPVLDRGGAIKGHRLDVLFATHEQALKWGVQRLEVTVWEYADGKPHGFKPRYNRAASIQD